MNRLLIVDDHPLFRDALSLLLLNARETLSLAAEQSIQYASTLEGALDTLLQGSDFDLVLLDLHLPGHDGFWGLIEMRKRYPAIPVLVISGNDDASVIAKSKACGASGFVSKSAASQKIVSTIAQLLLGDEVWGDHDIQPDTEVASLAKRLQGLTDQQRVVLKHLQEGRLNKQIAYDLAISEATVKAHVTAIFRKLGVLNRTQAVILANKLQAEAPLSSQ